MKARIIVKTVLFLLLLTGMNQAVLAQQDQQRRAEMEQRMEQRHQEMMQRQVLHRQMMLEHRQLLEQGQQQHAVMSLPGLTDEQKEQIKQLHLDTREALLPLQNELGELRARLNTLSSQENANTGEINRTADRIGEIQAEIIKRKMATHRQVRDVLTDEQRVIFDSRTHRFLDQGTMHGPMQGVGMRRPGMNRMHQGQPAWNIRSRMRN